MAFAGQVSTLINGTWYGFYTKDEIERLSVKEITNPRSLDELGSPIRNGLYDPALGPTNPMEVCETCGLTYDFCPGHLGHISLCVTVYHPLLFNILYKLLRATCFNCHQFRMPQSIIDSFITRFRLLDEGKLLEALSVVDKGAKTSGAFLETAGVNVDAQVAAASILEARERKSKKSSRRKPKLGDDLRALVHNDSLVANVINEKLKLFTTFLRTTAITKCQRCSAHNPGLRKDADSKIFQNSLSAKNSDANRALGLNVETLLGMDFDRAAPNFGDTPKKKEKAEARYIPPTEVKERISRLFRNEPALVQQIFKSVFPNFPGATKERVDSGIFFLDTLLVPPGRFRPAAKGMMGSMDHPQNVYYKTILNVNHKLLDSRREGSDKPLSVSDAIQCGLDLQRAVNGLMDNSKQTNMPNGIKQLLEKKQGLFRMNMMGKRVNYAARSVISPDPYINTCEIGVPEVFAKKLTFAEPVTEFNYKELCEMIINGPDVHPGANAIEDQNGRKIVLKPGKANLDSRIALSKTLLTPSTRAEFTGIPKKVYRHLITGDVVLMNRQPTLHKPSMMSMRTVVQKGERVIRMHYANCKTFNADFDGDEMNMHFPQTFQARSDAWQIMFSDRQYLVPTNGAPLRGLIQDHVVTGVLLTKRDTFFTKSDFQQLYYNCCVTSKNKNFVTPPPCIWKPQQLWSGKQVITAILRHLTSEYKVGLNLDSRAQVGKEMWANDEFEQLVIFRNGELLTGVLDKAQYGSATFGLVHSCYELYGPTMAGLLLSTLGRLFTIYLQFCGFTCGIDDLIVTDAGNQIRSRLLKKADVHGMSAAMDFSSYSSDRHANLTEALRESLTSDDQFKKLDNMVKGKVNQLTTDIIKSCIPKEQMKQFPKNFLSLMILSGAKGSNVNISQIACLLGQQELEGRRVPTMYSGKTLPSFRPYDTRARAGGYVGDRFLTGIRPQEYYFHCMAGREGLVDTAVKTANSGYLQRCLIKHFEGLMVSYDYTVRDSDGSIVQFCYGDDAIDPMNSKFLTQFDFLAANAETIRYKYDLDNILSKGYFDSKSVEKFKKHSQKLSNAAKEQLDPLPSVFSPGTHFGCVSPLFESSLEEFIQKNPKIFERNSTFTQTCLKTVDPEVFKNLMYMKYMRTLVNPGEACGVVAGQSIGEPSTQMTLNTFHLAGHGGANVTLGIPRLREILMTASETISTPSMVLPLKAGVSSEQAYELANKFYRLSLPELLREITVNEVLQQSAHMKVRLYDISLYLHDDEYLMKEHNFVFSEIGQKLGNSFTPALHSAIVRELKTHCSIDSRSSSPGASSGIGLSGDDEEENLPPAAELRSAEEDIQVRKKKQQASYEDSDEERENRDIPQLTGKSLMDELEDEEDLVDEPEQGKSGDSLPPLDKKKSKTLPGRKPQPKKTVVKASSLRYVKSVTCDETESKIVISIEVPASDKKLLMVSLVERVADSYIVSAIPGITQCYIQEQSGSYSITTMGVNFEHIWHFGDLIDLDKIACNDIFQILNTYGIEAARASLIQEIKNVFGAYGIKVDPRHLSLVGDYMTFTGTVRGCNRTHMNSKDSPWLRMSFETTVKFLAEAALLGQYDPIQSPSASLVVGNPVRGGSGYMDILYPLV